VVKIIQHHCPSKHIGSGEISFDCSIYHITQPDNLHNVLLANLCNNNYNNILTVTDPLFQKIYLFGTEYNSGIVKCRTCSEFVRISEYALPLAPLLYFWVSLHPEANLKTNSSPIIKSIKAVV